MNVKFPVTESILSPQALAEDILPGFGVGSIARCDFFSGGFNHTYRVKTTQGVTYYMRSYRINWRTLADIEYELDVLDHLKGKGFPAAKPVTFQDGLRYCAVSAPEGVRYLVLFTEASGPEVSYDLEPAKIARHYGQAVAQMHNALDDFSSSYTRFHLDIEHFINHSLRNIEPLMENRAEDWVYIQQFAERLRQRILAIPVAALEQGFCHGDLQGYHANVAPDGTLTFFDFDCGGLGFRAYDLAVFLWCCRLQDAAATRWEPFLQGYRETRCIQDLDVRAVPLFVCARYLWHMGVHCENSGDWGVGFINDQYFTDHLKRLRQAESDYLTDTGEPC